MEKKKTGLAVASLTLGVISIILSWFWYVTMPAGIMAVIFGTKCVKKTGNTCAKAGIITGIIGLALFVFFYGAALTIIFGSM